MQEGSLHNWFSKSKSKDGKPGWVQSDGSPCANEKGETKTPKCYSSRRLAGLKKSKEGQKKIRSADARKSREDPGQQSKSGASKPTMVRTFKDKKDYKKHPSGDTKREEFDMTMQEEKDKKGAGSGTKDACYHKVKSRYDVWPSAYASGALVKCRRKGAKNWGKSPKKEEYLALPEFSDAQIVAMESSGVKVEIYNEMMNVLSKKKGPSSPADKAKRLKKLENRSKELDRLVAQAKDKNADTTVRREETELQEKEVKVKDTRRTVDAIRAYDRSKDASRDATYDTDHGKKKKGDKEKAYAKKERGEIDKDDPNWKHRKYHTGMHGESVDIGELIRADRERLESMDEATYPSDFRNPDGSKRAVAKRKEGRPIQHDQPTNAGRRKTVDEEMEGLEEARIPSQQGNIYMVTFSWRGKLMYMKVFFPEPYGPNRERVEVAMNKIYPGARVRSYDMAFVSQGDSYLNAGSPEGGDGAQKRPKK